jgi:hypothetical protein
MKKSDEGVGGRKINSSLTEKQEERTSTVALTNRNNL